MRLAMSIVVSLMVSLILFAIVKMWGKSQIFIDYQHPFYALDSNQKTPLVFLELHSDWTIDSALKKYEEFQIDGVWINVAVTSDQKTVVLKKPIEQVRKLTYTEIQNDAYTAVEMKSFLSGRRVILNFLENPISGPELIQDFIKESGLIDKKLFAVVSPYDPPMKFLKEQQPTFLYGTTQPEILRIKALESVFLIEASTFRADLIVYPWDFYGHQSFFSDALVAEMNRRFKRLVVGPIAQTQWEDLQTNEKIRKVNPFIVVIR